MKMQSLSRSLREIENYTSSSTTRETQSSTGYIYSTKFSTTTCRSRGEISNESRVKVRCERRMKDKKQTSFSDDGLDTTGVMSAGWNNLSLPHLSPRYPLIIERLSLTPGLHASYLILSERAAVLILRPAATWLAKEQFQFRDFPTTSYMALEFASFLFSFWTFFYSLRSDSFNSFLDGFLRIVKRCVNVFKIR